MADDLAALHLDIASQAFWRRHFPKLHICETLDGALRDRIVATPPRNVQLNAERMAEDGYFQDRNDTLVRLSPVLAEAVKTCKRLDIPPAFLFLFDEAWECFHALAPTLAQFLGSDFVMLPDFWVWHVDPKAQESGWTPHRDKGFMALGPNGEPLSLTVWMPLTDAMPINGCMYMLPAGRDPVYGTTDDKNWQVDFPSIRALPARPGDFLCWNQAVLHWGARSSRFAQDVRISMAFEFQRADVAPFNKPLLPLFANLDFPSRLWLVGKQIMQYRHMYKVRPEYEALAQSLLNQQQ